MKVLVYPHVLSVGGSQLNAVELAGAVRDLGHEVVVFGTPGALTDVIADLGLPYVPCPVPGRRPSAQVVRALRALHAREAFDVLHGYEWPPALEAQLATGLRGPAATVCTVMSMGVAPFLPSSMPLVVGTRQIQEQVQARRRGPVDLIEPPVDVRADAPQAPAPAFLAEHGLDPRDLHVVVVSRLARELKLAGLLEAVAAVDRLADELPVRLVVVGDGPARNVVQAAADAVDRRHGRSVVVLTGEVLDPRPAYALADVALGMGGSALRAMAFARPLVVQGEGGFWSLLDPSTLPVFLQQGWYGVGDGDDGTGRLTGLLAALLADPGRRAELGAYARSVVVDRFSLERAARTQAAVYERALAARPSAATRLRDGAASARGLLAHETGRRWQRLRGVDAGEDFNALAAQVRAPAPTAAGAAGGGA